MTITTDLIEVPEDVLHDVFVTHAPIGIVLSEPFACEEPVCHWEPGQCSWAEHLLEAVKEAARNAEFERLERPFKDSRR